MTADDYAAWLIYADRIPDSGTVNVGDADRHRAARVEVEGT